MTNGVVSEFQGPQSKTRLLCVEAPGRELGVRAHEHRVAVADTGVLRVLLHVRVQREDERTAEAEAAAVREDGEAAELVVAGVLRAADGADGGERGREPEEEVRRGRVEASYRMCVCVCVCVSAAGADREGRTHRSRCRAGSPARGGRRRCGRRSIAGGGRRGRGRG